MHYTLHQLQVFHKVCETHSITKAAEELFLTQPAVSIQLKNFQEQFEFPLTEVVGRKLYITDFGREIDEAVGRILQEIETIDHRIKEYKGQLHGKLKISVVSTGKYVIPYILTDFLKENPGVELQLDVTNKTKVAESLEENTVDFSLVFILPENVNFNKIELLENELCLVASSKLDIEDKVHPTEILKNLNFIFRESGSGTRQAMENFFLANELKIKRGLELASNEAVKQAVIADLGVSIMPLMGIKHELKTGRLKVVKVEGLPIKTHWNLIWQKSKKLSPAASAFLDYVKNNKEAIIAKYFD